jgi:hypothetical protein
MDGTPLYHQKLDLIKFIKDRDSWGENARLSKRASDVMDLRVLLLWMLGPLSDLPLGDT